MNSIEQEAIENDFDEEKEEINEIKIQFDSFLIEHQETKNEEIENNVSNNECGHDQENDNLLDVEKH
ncbi:unnamed protein product [Adineta steineri]|uniref:Uncharacterized protein n=1 Tax=Adineta steineri TaxID=433720 RepID=A0A819KR97_9BILA|nr:unnamed protein product [Adineta steineri]CAF3949209.1 unnamed protein product [Adineta steineri]